jgi:ATP-binding cassette, subfamily B, bacterial
MPEQDPHKHLGFRDFFAITIWVGRTYFQISPVWVTVALLTTIYSKLWPLIQSLILAKIIDALIQTAQSTNPSLNDLVPYLVIFFLLNQSQNLVSIVGVFGDSYLNNVARTRLRVKYIDKLNHLGIETLEDPDVANKMARTEDNMFYIHSYLRQLITAIASIFSIFSAGLVLVSNVPFMLPLLVILSIPNVFVDRHFIHEIWKFDFKITEERRKAGASFVQLTSAKALQEISVTSGFQYLRKKYWDSFKVFDDFSVRIRRRWKIFGTLFGVIQDIGIFAGYILILARLIAKQISIGDTTFQMRSLELFNSEVGGFAVDLNALQEQSVRLKDVSELFNMQPLFADGKLSMPYPSPAPSLSLKDISFRYPRSEAHIFKNLNLEIKSGEKVAIVGHNGAGKTTLIKLISRLYPVTSGQILINGINLNALKIEDWYKNIGVLFQDFNNYDHLTVTENIFMGRPEGELDIERIKAAAVSADADDFVQEFPLKYEQRLGERYKDGIRPSGGMWQKIAIARFFYRNAPLVIFDEPTAAIDAVSEYKIFNRIYDFFKNKTVIIVSHRFSTVRNADRIIVMDKGQIVEEGTHEELMAKNGKYTHAFKLQAEGYQH